MKSWKTILGLLLLTAIVGLASWYGYDLLFRKEKPATIPASPETTTAIGEPPTLSPEKKEIIAKIETHAVKITSEGFSPAELTIKRYDQVSWENQDSTAHQVKGEGWGNVPIQSGRRFTQSFDESGVFPYQCVLHPEMNGKIIVE